MPNQSSTSVLQPTDSTITVQHGLLLLAEALGPGLRLQRHDVRLAMPGWLPDLQRIRQGDGEAAHSHRCLNGRHEQRNETT